MDRPIGKVISGGQTGADQAGLRAARRFGIATGGWMPKGFLTEDGPRPQFAGVYGAQEHESPEYPKRRMANLVLCGEGVAVVFDGGRAMSPGTKGLCSDHANLTYARKPRPSLLVIRVERSLVGWAVTNPAYGPPWLVSALAVAKEGTLLVAGNRESKSPGIGDWVESYLCEVFHLLGYTESPR